MIIECYRGAGDKPAAHIDAPMLSDTALIHRGRAEMDARAHAINSVDLDIVWRTGLRLGALLDTTDPASNTPLRGKVTGISLKISEANITTQLNVEALRE